MYRLWLFDQEAWSISYVLNLFDRSMVFDSRFDVNLVRIVFTVTVISIFLIIMIAIIIKLILD